MRSILLVLAASAGAVPVAAQCSSGPFVAAPFALSTAEDPQSAFASGELYHKALGFQAVAPTVWAPARGVPDFRLAPMFRACRASPPYPDVDAVSLGEDWILADDATGRIDVPQDRWAGLTFSVTRATVGAPGSVIRGESVTPDGAAGDLFSWILPGSAMPAPLVGRTARAHDSREVDLGRGAADIDALDGLVPLWRQEPGIRNAMLGPARVFFSFSRATLARVPGTWWAGTSPSAATIFQVVWNTQSGQWSCPRIWRTYLELGLNVGEDVDALAVDLRNERLLFSTTTRSRDPLLFLYYGTDFANPVTYTDTQGQPVSGNIGLINDDDIDAICALDPSTRAAPGGGMNGFGFFMGTPRAKAFPFPSADLSSAAYRTLSGGASAYRTFVTGWPTGTGRGPGMAVLFLSFAAGPPGLLPIAVVARDPSDPICGNPVDAAVPVPVALSLSGAQVDLRWFVADQAVTSIGEAWPIRVRL